MSESAANVAKLCRDLDRKVHEYAELVERRAHAEVDYKSARAKRILRAKSELKAEGDRPSVAEAEKVAEADAEIEALWRAHLIAEGAADACGKAIAALRERINFGRSMIATEREQDRLHSQGGTP